jgi:tripartite-type tricarboxylate transporter receptor subunit TctC
MRAIGIAVLAIALAIGAQTGSSRAQPNYPTCTVKLIIPYPPGGGTDLLARVLAQQLQQKWKQSVIVENIGGAGANTGAQEVAQAAPDGYTLLLSAPGPLAFNSLVYEAMPYDPAKWVGISMLTTSPFVLAVSPDFAATKLAQVGALAVTSKTRLEALADILTVAETVPGYEASGWLGVGAPASTSTEIMDWLNANIDAVLTGAKAKSGLTDIGVVIAPMAPDDYRKFIAADVKKWGNVIKFAGIKPV